MSTLTNGVVHGAATLAASPAVKPNGIGHVIFPSADAPSSPMTRLSDDDEDDDDVPLLVRAVPLS